MAVNKLETDGIVQSAFSGDNLPEVLKTVAEWADFHSEDVIEDITVEFDYDNGLWIIAVYWSPEEK